MSDCNDNQYIPPYEFDGLPTGDTPVDPPVTEGFNPVVDLRYIGEICADIGLNPENIHGMIALLVKQVFRAGHVKALPVLDDIVWSDNNAVRTVNVLSVDEWQPDKVEQDHIVVYGDAGQRRQQIAIGDQHGQGSAANGADIRSCAMIGSHNLMCISTKSATASAMVTELMRFFTEFSQDIIRHLPFHDFQVLQRQSPNSLSDIGDRHAVALGLSYTYIWTWETRAAGLPVKTVELHVDTAES